MRQRLGAPVAVILGAMMVTACTTAPATGAPATAGPPASGAPPVTAAPATPIPVVEVQLQMDFRITATSGALLWGIDKGYFTEAGIDLDLIPGTGSDLALNQIDAGNVDFAFIDGSNYIKARGEDVTQTMAVYALQNISSTAIASKVQINEPEDMIGKSFGTVAFSSGRQKIPLILEQNGVDPEQVPIELMDFSVLYPSLFEGTIDTAEVGLPGSWEGALTSAQEQGIELFVKPISDWGYRDYSKVMIVSNSVIEENEDLVSRLVAAVYRSQTDALANATPEEIAALVQQYDPQVDTARAVLEWTDVVLFIKDPGPMDDATFQYQLDQLPTLDPPVVTELTPADLYTNEYIPS